MPRPENVEAFDRLVAEGFELEVLWGSLRRPKTLVAESLFEGTRGSSLQILLAENQSAQHFAQALRLPVTGVVASPVTNPVTGAFLWAKSDEICAAALFAQTFETVELNFVTVAAPLRKKKLSHTLLAQSFKILKSTGAHRVMLEVATQNLAAIACYSGLGFRQIAVRKNYYPNADDALVMEKIL